MGRAGLGCGIQTYKHTTRRLSTGADGSRAGRVARERTAAARAGEDRDRERAVSKVPGIFGDPSSVVEGAFADLRVIEERPFSAARAAVVARVVALVGVMSLARELERSARLR